MTLMSTQNIVDVNQKSEIEGQNLTGNPTIANQKIRFDSNIDQSKVIYRDLALYDNPDRTFERWGHLLYPILTTHCHGRIGFGQGYRYWEQNGAFKKFLPRNTPFYPHEELNYQLNQILNGELVESRFHVAEENESHAGYTHFWTLLSDKFNRKLPHSYRLDDVVQVGILIRNGIQTDEALGIDIFTQALKCMNGAVARGPNFGSFAIKHVGSYEKMKEAFLQYIPLVIEKAQRVVDIYDKSTKLVMTQERAEKFFKKAKAVSNDYFPENFELDEDKRKDSEASVKDIVRFNPKGNVTVWETFNDFTQNLWHSEKLKFSGKRNHTTQIHNALFDIVGEVRAIN